MRSYNIAITLVILASPSLVAASDPGAISAGVDGLHRSEMASARDAFRHPNEVLGFCGLGADQDILEIWPGGGWYTDILAPVVREGGSYTAAIFGPHAPEGFRPRLDGELRARFADNPEIYGVPRVVPLWVPQNLDLGDAGSIDTVFTFRNLHNWLKGEYEAEILASVYEVLEPGGTFCVVDHRANAQIPIDPLAESGYVDEGYAIQVITAAGFRLEAVSDINDNPRDTSDHPRGVWTLPPSLRLGEEDREHYQGIGESDRFTLRFVKPE
jgi:predicted methyltransferase